MMERISISLLFIILVTVCMFPTSGHAENHKINLLGCENKVDCIPVLFDTPQSDENTLIVGREELPNGYTNFKLKISGIIKGKIGTLTVYFIGYTDGIECTAFGQGYVGFLGYSSDEHPIINTSEGPPEVLTTQLIFGCKGCIKSLDKNNNITGTYLSPSYDLLLTGDKESDFSVDDKGQQYFHRGKQCFQLPPKNLIRQVNPKMCTSQNPPKVRIKIEVGSCS